jgi:hypothetical protein
MPNFCGPSDPGPEARADSDTGFTLLAYSCQQSTRGCRQTVSFESGSGSLSGGTLTLVTTGHVLQQADGAACAADTVAFTLTASLTRNDPRLSQLAPITGAWVEIADFFGEFRVHWDPPDSGIPEWPAYPEWQVARLGGGWEAFDLHDNNDGRSGTVFLDAQELEVFRFRVRSTNGHAASAFTPDILATTGFRAPYSFTLDQRGAEAHLSWTEPPRPQATRLEIERGALLADGGVTFSPLADVTPPASAYVDPLPGEGGTYLYRGRWFSPTVRGYPFVAWGFAQAPLYAPEPLVIAADRTGFDLHWTNRSALATEIVVRRTPERIDVPSLTVHLLPTATSYRDNVPFAGAYLYSVQAISPTVSSAMTSGWSATLLDPTLGLESGILELPPPDSPPCRDSAGHWYFFSAGNLIKTGDPGWIPHSIPAAWRVAQPVAIDSLEHPHTLTGRSSASGSGFELVHEWFDGAWHSESLATVQLADGVPVRWQLDAARRPVVAVASGADSTGVHVIRWSGSNYVVESPAAALPRLDSLRGLAIALAPDGRVEVALSGTQGLLLLERAATWTSTTLSSSLQRPDLEILAGATTLDLLARIDGFDSSAFVLHRNGSVWSPPQSFPSLCCGAPLISAATTPAGTRPAALLEASVEGKLIAHGDDGWSTQALGWGDPVRAFGYDPAGKMYGLLWVEHENEKDIFFEFHEP